MKNIIKISKKYFKLIKEGSTLKDKFFISYYIAISFFIKNFKINYAIKMENKYGKYLCGKNLDEIWIASSFHEPQVYKELVSERFDIFLDIGSNIGKYAISYGRIYPSSKIYCFEAEKYNFEILKKNIILNNLKHIYSFYGAVSDKDGFIDFYIFPIGGGGHSLIWRDSGKKIIIKSRSLDRFFKNKEDLKDKSILIKIDVEGSEINVLNGMKKIILKNQPKIIFEAHNKKYLLKIRDFLSQFNYKIKKIGEIEYVATKS